MLFRTGAPHGLSMSETLWLPSEGFKSTRIEPQDSDVQLTDSIVLSITR